MASSTVMQGKFYSGCSGLVLPMPKAQYPPEFQEKSRLEYYAHLFNSLEVNSIFYKLPRVATITNWVESVPENFRFTFKLSKTVTHVKELDFKSKDVSDFMRTIEPAKDKKGCLLVQFPPGLKIEKLDQIQNLFEVLGEETHDSGWNVAVEFRNSSWYEREVYELLAEYDFGLVRQDIPASATPADKESGDFIYLRFHGPEPRYRGSYTDEVLKKQARQIKEWMKEGKTVYAYFNNTMGDAVNNLQTLNKLVLSK